MKEIKNTIDEYLYAKCSSQESDILLYLKHNLEQIPDIAISVVADNTFCSTTSVTRLVKKLGFTNYRELQYAIRLQYNIYGQYTNPIVDNDYTSFVSEIKSSDCVYVYGKGASHISAHYLFRKLIKANINASLIDEQDLLYSLNGRTIIIISNSGRTSSVLEIIRDIKEINQCNILAITELGSPLAKLAIAAINVNGINSERDDQKHLMQEIDYLLKHIN